METKWHRVQPYYFIVDETNKEVKNLIIIDLAF